MPNNSSFQRQKLEGKCRNSRTSTTTATATSKMFLISCRRSFRLCQQKLCGYVVPPTSFTSNSFIFKWQSSTIDLIVRQFICPLSLDVSRSIHKIYIFIISSIFVRRWCYIGSRFCLCTTKQYTCNIYYLKDGKRGKIKT